MDALDSLNIILSWDGYLDILKLREFGYRVLIMESYLVFYIIRGQTVEIHRVVHGSRNLNHLI